LLIRNISSVYHIVASVLCFLELGYDTGVRDGHAVDGEQLSQLTMAISDTVVDLNVLPI
jgi:hypothetical protein